MQRILVTGGAGYIGSVTVRLLLQAGYFVRVLDNLCFGGEPIVELLNIPEFEFQKGDIRVATDVSRAVEGMDAVVHLAAIVGDPACAKDPDTAVSTNLTGGRLLFQQSKKAGLKRFVFASTCSNYGKMADSSTFVDEESILAPVSLYAKTKVDFESFLLNGDRGSTCKPICLRFSTVYGLSPRIRFDLTVNEFTKEIAMGRELVVYGQQFWRPYCHVVDLASSILLVLNSEDQLVDFNVFNVGSTNENYQKKMIVEEILKKVPEGRIRYVERDEDPRDYRVDFEKIKVQLGFEISKTVPDGIEQLVKALREGFFENPDDARFRNI